MVVQSSAAQIDGANGQLGEEQVQGVDAGRAPNFIWHRRDLEAFCDLGTYNENEAKEPEGAPTQPLEITSGTKDRLLEDDCEDEADDIDLNDVDLAADEDEDEDEANEMSLYAIAWLSDKVLACAGGDGDIHVLYEDVPVQRISKVHHDSISRLRLSPDGLRLAAVSLDGILSVYTLNREAISLLEASAGATTDGEAAMCEKVDVLQLSRVYEEPTGDIEDFVWSRNSQVLLVACADKTAWVFHVKSESAVAVFSGHARRLVACALSEPSCVTADEGGEVCVWDARTAALKHKINLQPKSHAGRRGKGSRRKGVAHLGGAEDDDGDLGSDPDEEEKADAILSLSVHPTAPLALVGCADGTIHLLQIERGEIVRTLRHFEDGVESLAFEPTGGEVFAAGDATGALKLFSTTHSAMPRLSLPDAHQGSITSLAWLSAPQSKFENNLVSLGSDGTAKLWNCRQTDASLALVDTLYGFGEMLVAQDFRPSADALAVVSEDGSLMQWTELSRL